MIKESIRKDDADEKNDSVDFKTMLILAIATSIDALAVGITFAFLKVNVIIAILIIRNSYIYSIINRSKIRKFIWRQI